jgi:chorismate synthase
MASNFFGQLFRITTFGESHGPAIGVVIDGCPAGLALSVEEISQQLALRQPGKSPFTSPRTEPDHAEILSGVFEGHTTGAPIAILIRNQDADTRQYETLKNLYRPGHANFTYLKKYEIFDFRGGGRASARETAARVAAAAVAKKLLAHFKIDCVAFICAIGTVEMNEIDPLHPNLQKLRQDTYASPVFCPDEKREIRSEAWSAASPICLQG